MVVGTAMIKLQAPWVHSLKEKRMLVQSIINKAKNKFNISIAEVDAMDVHQTVILGLCCVSNNGSLTRSILDKVVCYIEDHTEAVVEDVQIEVL